MTDIYESTKPEQLENTAVDDTEAEEAVSEETESGKHEAMPNMLDTIWEAEDLGIQGGFMYYFPDGKK